MSDTEIDTMLKDAMKTERIKDAANMVAAASGRSKRDLYNRALALKDSEL